MRLINREMYLSLGLICQLVCISEKRTLHSMRWGGSVPVKDLKNLTVQHFLFDCVFVIGLILPYLVGF